MDKHYTILEVVHVVKVGNFYLSKLLEQNEIVFTKDKTKARQFHCQDCAKGAIEMLKQNGFGGMRVVLRNLKQPLDISKIEKEV